MAQHNYVIDDADGATFLADLNDMAEAMATENSGASAPATTYAYQLWADTTSGWLKQRNAANSAWIRRWPLGTNGAVDIASAATLDLDANAASSGIIRVTGTTTTTAITLAEGQVRTLRAAGAWPITHGASLICPGAASYTCAAGDLVTAIGEAAGVVRLAIDKADGTAVAGVSAVVQTVEASPITALASCPTGIPFDDTLPQSTEGDQVISASITPTSASHRLRIEFDCGLAGLAANSYIIAALFQDSGADALAAAIEYTNTAANALKLVFEMAAGTTISTTFKIRVGSPGGTVYINGYAGARVLGGASAARLRITEFI